MDENKNQDLELDLDAILKEFGTEQEEPLEEQAPVLEQEEGASLEDTVRLDTLPQEFAEREALPDAGRAFCLNIKYQSTIKSVPTAMSAQPAMDLGVNCSCKTTAASTMVITTLSLSIGTTLEASPICNAL